MQIEKIIEQIKELKNQEDSLFDNGPGIYSYGSGQTTNTIAPNDELKKIRRKRKVLAQQLATYPEAYKHMYCWMIDVSVKSDNDIDEESLQLLNEERREDFVDKHANFAKTVREFLHNEFGQYLRDVGSGCGSVDLGYHCGEETANNICSLLHNNFQEAIRLGLLKISRKFWGWNIVWNGENIRLCSSSL